MLGVVLALLAAGCYGISASVQKRSMGHFDKFDVSKMLRQKIWLFSILIGAVGVILYLVSLAMEDLTTVQPLLSVSLIIPIVAGVGIFREKHGRLEWIAIFLVLCGIVLVSI
ncbi:MAG: EamA family transporter [Candidatus Aenigmarchaeota archaeon]|nr:EamA family transporter [Candidatus Aenigmarchaeota archaeon]